MLYKKWHIKEYDHSDVEKLARELSVESLLAKVLLSKGIKDKAKAQEKFLSHCALSDPYLMKDMDKAVERIHTAIENNEKIVIYGDYDVDGVCATATLFLYLESVGANVFYKLPNRETDGYGLNKKVLERLKAKHVDLVVTVDNGISAIDEVEFANEIGLDIIVTDHHLPKEKLPNAIAVVDPLRFDDTSPCKTLAGVGVAFKLVTALEDASCQEMLDFYADIVAVGTVADLMNLEGENREIVKAGLELLNEGSRIGFKALTDVCNLQGKEITSESIGYLLAPRINAAGRMGDPTIALDLLLSEDEEDAMLLAGQLESENQRRQETQNKMADDITNDIFLNENISKERVIVVWSENFHAGVVGIVAARLVERYSKPAIVLTKDGDEYKGSGRSVDAFSLHGALKKTSELLLRFGGHDLAAGLSLKAENLQAFKEAINKVADECRELDSPPVLEIDCSVDLQEINVNSVKQINYLAPFGNANSSPSFMIKGLHISNVISVSDGKHVRLKLSNSSGTLQGIMFNIAPQEFGYLPGDIIDVYANLSIYHGDSTDMVSVRIKDVRPTDMKDEIIDSYNQYRLFRGGIDIAKLEKQAIAPTREEIAVIYRIIQSEIVMCEDLRPLFFRHSEFSSGKLMAIVDILLELGLIAPVKDGEKNIFKVLPVREKRDLSTSDILKKLQQ